MEQGNRKAVTPAHATLNYLYAVLEAEARLTALQFGFDPGIGIFHATYQGRDSFPLDLMEPVRPLVDRYVLQLLKERAFSRDHFFETREGIFRILPELAEELSQTAVLWRGPLRELTEAVADTLMEATDEGSRGLLSLVEGHTAHGQELTAPLTTFSYSVDSLEGTQWKNQLRKGHKQNRTWERDAASEAPDVDFEEDILPGLQGVTGQDIADATGLSYKYANEIQRGEKVPHRRYWKALAELAEDGRDSAERQRDLQERFAATDFEKDIRPSLESYTLRKIADATGLSRSYVGEIRRGEKVPSLKHGDALARIADGVSSDAKLD